MLTARLGLLSCLIAILAVVPAAQAVVVIDYDVDNDNDVGTGGFDNPDDFTALDLDSDGPDDAEGWLADHTDLTLAMPAPATYNGPDYYGAIRAQKLNATSFGFDDRSAASFKLRLQGLDERLHGVLYFRSDSPVTLDAASWIAFAEDGTEATEEINPFQALEEVRWLVLTAAGDWYVSDLSVGNSADGATLTGNELFGLGGETAANWASTDPVANINLDLGSLSYTVSTSDLNAAGLSGFGVYMEEDGIEGDDRVWFGFNGFTVGAVPEPATLGLLGLGGLAALLRRRHR
jgi:hypothetical protein